MSGYLRPVGDVYVPSDWQDHRDRTPPSTEPGTDYAVAVGTEVLAPADGFVVGVKPSNTGASGRALMINTSGDYHRALHLQSLSVVFGQRFRAGQRLAISGASANGSNHGTGAHLHWSFWRRPGFVPTPGLTPTQDFELYVQPEAPAGGGDSPLIIPSTLEEFDMDNIAVIRNAKTGTYALVGAQVPAKDAAPAGAWTTSNQATANTWALLAGRNAVERSESQFAADIDNARVLARTWIAQQKAIHA